MSQYSATPAHDGLQGHDVEKLPAMPTTTAPDSSSGEKAVGSLELTSVEHTSPPSKLQRIADRLEILLGLETRGIERVPESMRFQGSNAYDMAQIGIVWFAANCTANNVTTGVLGPVEYDLGFVDAMCCCAFGNLLGSAFVGYSATFGPISGNRTLINARYAMGWWPVKIAVLFNIVVQLGWGLIDSLVSGMILSAVNGHNMSITVGIVISSLLTWLVIVFGIKWFHHFERYAWIPQVMLLLILFGTAGPGFNIHSQSKGEGAVLNGNRLSYLLLSASGALGWSACACDFFVYFPPKTNRWVIFATTTIGLTLGKSMIEFMGVGLGSGIAINPSWKAAFAKSKGALIVQAFTPLGPFGNFCSVLAALGIVANNVPGIYSASLCFQMLGKPFEKVPRIIWCTVGVIIFTVCAIAGQAQLFPIFVDFLSLIGYWIVIWITITASEQVIFRRRIGYIWENWNDPKALPVGIAAFLSFGIGWVAAVLCMDQTYYTGPIAKLVGDGSDLGIPVAIGWTLIVYPPLRFVELKHFKR